MDNHEGLWFLAMTTTGQLKYLCMYYAFYSFLFLIKLRIIGSLAATM